MRTSTLGRKPRRRWIAAMVLSLTALAGSMSGLGSAQAVLPGVGTGAYMIGPGGGVQVYPSGIGHRMYVLSFATGCSADIAVGRSALTVSAGLTTAKVTAGSPCGLVSVTWHSVGAIQAGTDEVYRYAYASGSIGGHAVYVINPTYGLITLGASV